MDNSAQTNPAQSTQTPAPTETPASSSPPTPPTPQPIVEQTPPPAAPPIAEQTVETPASSSTLTPPTSPTPQIPTPADQTNPTSPTTMPDPFAQASAAVQVPVPGNPTDPTPPTESTIPQTDPQAPPPANPVIPTPQTPPASPTASKGGSFFKTLFIIFLVLGIIAAGVYFILPIFKINVPFLSANKQNLAKVCAQVISPAKNIKTGECKEFPTPCDIPTGWTKVSSCTPIPTPTIDPTANWKTYTNEKYNYSFKYPNNWQLIDSDLSSIKLYPPTSNINSKLPQPGIIIEILTNTFTKPLEQKPALTEISPITLDGIDGYKFKAEGAPFSTINSELPYQKGTLRIASAIDNNIDLKVSDQILSTFKFTNSTPPATPTDKNSSSDSAKTATPTPKLVK